MHPYTYAISLRLSHPSMDPAEITVALGREPRRAWRFGEPRQTPKGTPLTGTYRETYWYCRLADERASEEWLLEDSVTHFLTELDKSREFFTRIRAEGGRVEFFIGLYGSRNYGVEFAPPLLAAAASLGISIAFDIYPYPQNWR